MINKITSIEIYDFVAPDMPKDVVEIELLYKQENSPIIYSVAKLPKKDDFNDYWNLNGYNQDTSIVNSEYKGKYIINAIILLNNNFAKKGMRLIIFLRRSVMAQINLYHFGLLSNR